MSFWNDLCSSIRGNFRECVTTPLTRKKLLIIGGVVLVIIIIIIIIAVSVHASGTSKPVTGDDILKNNPFVLGGNSMSEYIKQNKQNKIQDIKNLDDILGDAHATIKDIQKGFVSTQIWDIGASECKKSQYKDAVSQTLDQIDLMNRIFKKFPVLTLLTHSTAITKANEKIVAGILRVDGGYTLDSKLSLLRIYYNLGVRIVNIGGMCSTPWTSSASDAKSEITLTDFGKEMIKEMSRLGMIIDISGASKTTQLEVLKTAAGIVEGIIKLPILISHSGSKKFSGTNVNNVDEDVLSKLKDGGGLLTLSFKKDQVCNSSSPCTTNEVINHLNELKNSLGVDGIGIGADFGSKGDYPSDLSNPSTLPELFNGLLKKGWSEEDLKKIAGQNFINLFKNVEKIAAAKQKDQPAESLISTKELPKTNHDEPDSMCFTDLSERNPATPSPTSSTTVSATTVTATTVTATTATTPTTTVKPGSKS